jgi:hypothetical protein
MANPVSHEAREIAKRLIVRFGGHRAGQPSDEAIRGIANDLSRYPRHQRTESLILTIIGRHITLERDRVIIEADLSDTNDLIDRLIDKLK